MRTTRRFSVQVAGVGEGFGTARTVNGMRRVQRKHEKWVGEYCELGGGGGRRLL